MEFDSLLAAAVTFHHVLRGPRERITNWTHTEAHTLKLKSPAQRSDAISADPDKRWGEPGLDLQIPVGSVQPWSKWRSQPLVWCKTLAQRGCNCAKGLVAQEWGGGMSVSVSTEAAWPWFTVTAALGMWGQQADRQARCLWSLFAPPSVLHLRALLRAGHWIHLEWLRTSSTF